MEQTVDERLRTRAKTPHEVFVVNLIGFHLLLTPAAIALGIGMGALLLPPLLSGAVIGFLAWRTRRAAVQAPWFVAAHWRLALRRGVLLLYGYGASGALVLLGWLLTLGIERPETQSIMFTVFTRIAVMPTFIMVLITFALSTSAIGQAGRGEVPDRIALKFPPPSQSHP